MRIILFDIDGTLLRTAKGRGYRAEIKIVLERVFGTYGLLGRVSFGGKTDLAILRESLEPVGIPMETIHERLSEWERGFVELTHRLNAEAPVFELCPGIEALVGALDADERFRLSLLTGNLESMATLKVAAVGLDPYFRLRGAYGGDHEDRNELPAIAARRIGAQLGRGFAPDDFVIIGDTPRDVAAARHFGMRSIAVATGPFDYDTLAALSPDVVLEDLCDAEAALAALNG